MIVYCITFLLHVTISCASEEEVCTTWEPFSFTEGGEDELQQFANFQNLMLSNENIPCELKRAVIFRANAGFGDSIQAMIRGFVDAYRHGYLFLLAERRWHFVLDPPFTWNFDEAVANGWFCRSQGDTNQLDDKPRVILVRGHVTKDHWVAKNKDLAINDVPMYFHRSQTFQWLTRPSASVQRHMLKIEHTNYWRNSFKVGIVIRTGTLENQISFLQPGDEMKFFRCWEKYREEKGISGSTVIYLASDSSSVVENLTSKFSEPVFSLDVEPVHTIHAPMNKEDELTKTLATWFLLSQTDLIFLTQGSLFGRAAAERGGVYEKNRYRIAASNCDDPKHPRGCGYGARGFCADL